MKRVIIAGVSYLGLALFAFLNGENPSVKTSQSQATSNTATSTRNPADYYSQEKENILEKAKANPNLSTFVSLLKSSGLADTIAEGGPYTIFAPSNQAFTQLPKGILDRLKKPESQRELIALLSYHIVPGKILTKDAKTARIRTLNGQDLNLEVMGGIITVDDAEVIQPDVKAKNGVIDVIDEVLSPAPAK